MNESNRNIRTLIVSFVVVVLTLIPLRFVEVGQMSAANQPQVLGVEEQIPVEEVVKLPELEAPYNEIENNVGCIDQELAASLLDEHELALSKGDLDASTQEGLIKEMKVISESTCK